MPLDSARLGLMGISPQLAAYYARTGWLKRLAHGIYTLPGDALTTAGMLILLQDRITGLHLAGRSALLPPTTGPSPDPACGDLVLMGEARAELPEWFTSRQPARYTNPRLFDWSLGSLSPEAGAALARQTVVDEQCATTAADRASPAVRRSVPERAILEMLYDIGTGEILADARALLAQFRTTPATASAPTLAPGPTLAPEPTLAPGPTLARATPLAPGTPRISNPAATTLHVPTLGLLLRCCTSIKTVRLLLTLARQTNLLDVRKLARDHSPRTGSPTRWMRRLPDGTLLSLRPYG